MRRIETFKKSIHFPFSALFLLAKRIFLLFCGITLKFRVISVNLSTMFATFLSSPLTVRITYLVQQGYFAFEVFCLGIYQNMTNITFYKSKIKI